MTILESPSDAPRIDRDTFYTRAATLCIEIDSEAFWERSEAYREGRLRKLYRDVFGLDGLLRLEAVHVYDCVAKKMVVTQELRRLGNQSG